MLPTVDHGERRELAPLRRRPKTLHDAPALFAAPGPAVLAAVDADPDDGPAVSVHDATQPAHRRELDELLEQRSPDPTVAAMARTIARRMSLRRRTSSARNEAGRGPLRPVPYHHRSDDVDLDRTIEVLAERRPLEATDIVVRERTDGHRTAVLIVDVSGSMKGEKVRVAAATVGALSAHLSGTDDRLAVVAFWSDAAVLAPLGPPVPPEHLVNQLLRVPAKGLTNVGFGLAVGHSELSRSRHRGRAAFLLTDAVHNAGPDPRALARRFPRLHVLLQTDGEHDESLGRDLSRLGHGRFATVRDHRDVAPALDRLVLH